MYTHLLLSEPLNEVFNVYQTALPSRTREFNVSMYFVQVYTFFIHRE